MIDLWFWTPKVITQIFNPAAELGKLIGIPNKEEKAEIEMHPVIAETKISHCSI